MSATKVDRHIFEQLKTELRVELFIRHLWLGADFVTLFICVISGHSFVQNKAKDSKEESLT